MPERLLDSLAEYFVYHKILEKRGITFDRFVELYKHGILLEYIN